MIKSGWMAGILAAAICAPALAQPPRGGAPSLTTPPYVGEAGAPAHLTGAPPDARPDAPVRPFQSVFAEFDPARQHFVWVLPPGLHAAGPWEFKITARIDDETKFETRFPVVAQIVPGGSRPEFPKGYEIVRLNDDGHWREHAAELDSRIKALIAQYGPGRGRLDIGNDLNLTVEDAAHSPYCTGARSPDIRFYLDEDGGALTELTDDPSMRPLLDLFVRKACEAQGGR